jgi:hypothetical protein
LYVSVLSVICFTAIEAVILYVSVLSVICLTAIEAVTFYVSVLSVICFTAIEVHFIRLSKKCWDEHLGFLDYDVMSSRQQLRTFRRILNLENAGMFLQIPYNGPASNHSHSLSS